MKHFDVWGLCYIRHTHHAVIDRGSSLLFCQTASSNELVHLSRLVLTACAAMRGYRAEAQYSATFETPSDEEPLVWCKGT